MSYIEPVFQAVSVTFAFAAVLTGFQAILDPIGFSTSFGLPIPPLDPPSRSSQDQKSRQKEPTRAHAHDYVSLMGARQLATGLTLLLLAYQGQWTASATVLQILGFVVAGTDGLHLARAGRSRLALFHAGPGALIAVTAMAFLHSR